MVRRSKILETRGNSRKVSNAQNFEIENLIYLKKFCWCEKICQQKLPICCENNNELHSTNPSNVWKQKTKCGSWNKKASWNRVRPERVRKGRLRRVGKILETRGNFDEVSEIKNQRFFRSNVFKAMFVNESADEDEKSELVRKWRVRRRQIRKGRLYHSPICCEIENLINDFIGE